ncbi:N(5)-glutamine methyltransferase MTQ2 [Sodiomyces alkalinus F11]|uniref:N(5)-glutamine methyltransferase MTQ2 n=1 Tax=Sodiomyces alkalinus (strain CBS 110278 / VKM F-3762 / F11) TaxID=1314773 RepID=A0A3N2Q043_SODAK|nr:N(5)-glutamine methyltransferase MTQ2 [Sodiomyces alkalinus F11]ROT40113.1 N(5)-glutamine methyltransferase MTQ2 [Sodiomyces alkalinus F11]
MLPTPDTSHVPFSRVYEPSEDSYLLLDTLSAPAETAFLHARFQGHPPLVLEVGTGSGVVIAFVVAQAAHLFGRRDILAAGVDVNPFACRATNDTVRKAQVDHPGTHAPCWLGADVGDLAAPLPPGKVDILLFNPPYVPSEALPSLPPDAAAPSDLAGLAYSLSNLTDRTPSFDGDSYLLALSYAGGRDGMETTSRLVESLPDILSARGCAYILLCAQNKPDDVKARVGRLGPSWRALTVGESGNKAGWEKLQVIRISKDNVRDRRES